MPNIKFDHHFFIIAITQKLLAGFYLNLYPVVVMKFFISHYCFSSSLPSVIELVPPGRCPACPACPRSPLRSEKPIFKIFKKYHENQRQKLIPKLFISKESLIHAPTLLNIVGNAIPQRRNFPQSSFLKVAAVADNVTGSGQ